MKSKLSIAVSLIFFLFFSQTAQADYTKQNLVISGNFKNLTPNDLSVSVPSTNDSLITINLKHGNKGIVFNGRYSDQENALVSNTFIYNYQTGKYNFSGELGQNQNNDYMSANFAITPNRKLTFSGNVLNNLDNKKFRIGIGLRYTF